ncbi:hypothetical protein JAAARDRAFT_503694 [Jaapia argillacea MUCL 33604]|uniref:F-box domain-containing protein n=1 Tax=Jaapia argillacea MUCL 33604 TaxID=933084 RepID=A0A067P9E8_9AGAM|nr:hypothetical protein JAAARDRAFT_503694 [Jaapia argillacea MUCL 33604]
MATNTLPPEICTRIAQFSRPSDLPALCRTRKCFLIPAQSKLYHTLMLGDPFIACHPLLQTIQNSSIGSYVRSLFIYQDDRLYSRRPIPDTFWKVLQRALGSMPNLEHLLIFDPTLSHSWVLNDPGNITFQLREAKFRLAWDEHTVAFFETQRKLTFLQCSDSPEGEPRSPLPTGALPTLRAFDGPMLVAVELLQCPLTHLQVAIDMEAEPHSTAFINLFCQYQCRKTLRSLSLLELRPEKGLETLASVANSIPDIRYLGIIPFISVNRHKFHKILMSFTSIKVLELDLTTWHPQPMPPPFQRAIVAEIRVYAPSLQQISLWVDRNRFMWTVNKESNTWTWAADAGRVAYNEALWRYQ